MKPAPFRIIDTDLRDGQQNIAFDQAMIEAHQAGEIPDTIRFIHFKPVVLVGRHQVVAQEINTDYCHANNIAIGRRITGGGALYLDQGQLGWAIICDRRHFGTGSLEKISTRICEAAATGLSKLGINARFRPRNDIEVEGRKISGTGGFMDGNTLIYQGTVLGQLDPDVMFSALNVPREKLAKREIGEAALRVTSLAELLGHAPDWPKVISSLTAGFTQGLNIQAEAGIVTPQEEERCKALFEEEIGTDSFIHELTDPARARDVKIGKQISPGGCVTAHIRLEGARNERLREVLITGDFFVTPPRIILDLEARLRRAAIEEIDETVADFFNQHEVGMLSVQPADFAAAIKNAVAA